MLFVPLNFHVLLSATKLFGAVSKIAEGGHGCDTDPPPGHVTTIVAVGGPWNWAFTSYR